MADAGDEPVALTDPNDLRARPISKVGDVWLLGPHRLLCGDSTDADMVADMLEGDHPDVVWTDPPYGVSYVGRTSEALTIENDGKADLPKLLPAAFRTIAQLARPGAPVYIAHADTERVLFEQSMLEAGLVVRQNLIWVKGSMVMGRSDYHYKHEPILEGEVPADVDDDGSPDHEPVLYGFTAGGKGRLGRGGDRWFGDNRATTVFEFPKPKRNAEHPTMKPIELIEAQLKNSCPPGGLVLDVFGGSGSTLIAAHHMKARSALVELDPKYADVICRRYQQHTGVTPIRRSTGKPRDFR
jgi:site-specific DNA-methyltransferase (adenine-specific)